MTNHAYRQGFEESWSTGAANPGSPQQPSLEKAAASIGISTVTAWRISKTREFKEEYRNARWEAFSQSLARLQQASGAAVSPLLKGMIDKTTPAASRARRRPRA